jgi:hypothetical protein
VFYDLKAVGVCPMCGSPVYASAGLETEKDEPVIKRTCSCFEENRKTALRMMEIALGVKKEG